ncbi:hypothetical protein [Halobacterium sp. KA-6]|uniref:hypothetical protein n=1 Tax=Halobacterium sp. KA-6 TaxID=2896368 RepID=UPI001E65A2ED|nr:hypothetical protein [Halobacterium sp. KA-6]MCD2204411.1 hypothetical protein [Halobacterium sp. KA-6]
MTAELDWVLEQFASVVDDIESEYTLASGDPVQVERIDRDNSRLLEQDVRSIRGDLQDANYVGATHVETVRDPVGTEYDASREVVVGVRVTGLTSAEYGHIDSEGNEGIPFDNGTDGLVNRLKDALWNERTWPDAGPGPSVYYKHLELQNEANQSEQWADFYRADWDVVFNGYEEL